MPISDAVAALTKTVWLGASIAARARADNLGSSKTHHSKVSV